MNMLEMFEAVKPDDNIDFGDKVVRTTATSVGQWGYMIGFFVRSNGEVNYVAEMAQHQDYIFYGPAEEFRLEHKLKVLPPLVTSKA